MAIFYNQATLSYGDNITNSNIVSGELAEVLAVTKTALSDGYTSGDTVTYIVSVTNSGAAAYNALTLTDDLGAYVYEGSRFVPLTYVQGSVKYYVNGVLQPAPAVTSGETLTVSGINVPAGGNAIIAYEARVNTFAPLASGAQITNSVTVGGAQASETITVTDEAVLTITKSLYPEVVTENGQLTYTFVIQNIGNVPIVATDDAVVTDMFDPILNPISVTYNGTAWTEGVNYTYNEATGAFATLAGQITVPAATYTRDDSGAWTVMPGTAVIRVTGTVQA